MEKRESRVNEENRIESASPSLDDSRAFAANAGDREAAGLYLRDNLTYLASMARWIARGALDPDDLLSEAIESLLARWKQGGGPTSRPNAYVIRSMRNRIIDERKSPRSRVLSTDNKDLDLPPVFDENRRIDLYREFEYVKNALTQLPANQQRVLCSVTIDGRKPAELVSELNRPASSIYSLLRRAKNNLKRETLREMLSENAPKTCIDASSRLPKIVTDNVNDAMDASGMPHIRTCKRCRGAWARFGSLASGLGVATVFLVASTLEAPAAASAATHVPRESLQPAGTKLIPKQFVTPVLVGAIVLGATLMVTATVPMFVQISSPSGRLASNLEVTTQVVEPGQATLDIELGSVPVGARITMRLPEKMSVQSSPTQWTCTSDRNVTQCETDRSSEGSFVLSDGRPIAQGNYSVSLTSLAPPFEVHGEAHGQITDYPQTVDSSAR